MPNLTVPNSQPIGKYGRMRLNHLKQNRPVLYTSLLMSGKLNSQLAEIDRTAESRIEQMTPLLKQQYGVTEELKATNQLAWVGAMNALHAQIEETIRAELIYS